MTRRRFVVLVSENPHTGTFTCHIYRAGMCVAIAQGGTANNAVRLAKALV